MDKLIDVLKKVLTEEIEEYKNLLNLIESKTDILIKGDIKKLDKMTEEEQKIIIKLGKFEDLREKVLYNIKHREGIEKDLDVTLLLDYIDDENKKQLKSTREDFLKILEKIKDRNKLNSTLIEDSLDYINMNLNILTNNEEDLNYGGNKKKSKTANSIFNTKA